jgi:hypothetical protein
MFTTAGIALFAATFRLPVAGLPPCVSAASRIVITLPLGRDKLTRSGRSVVTTNRTARQIVTAWENINQNLRMARNRFS